MATSRFIETMGLISQENGGSRISGRMIGLLVIEDRELSLSQISEKLGISRASVSTNARLLIRRGVIRRTAHAGDRQDYYELSSLPFFDMLGDLADQFARNGSRIGTCVEEMRADNPGAAERAAALQSFLEKSSHVLHKWAEALRNDAQEEENT